MSLYVDIEKRLGVFRLQSKFEVADETLALLGASGCGKSVTLKCIAGIMTPDRGRIVLNGRVLFDSEKKIALTPQQRRVGYLFQQYALFPNMTVEQNILCGIRAGSRSEKRSLAAEKLRMFRLEGLEKKYPAQLSGGQQQRIGILRALAASPPIVLMDEPFSALDPMTRRTLQQEVRSLQQKLNKTFVFVTHDMDEALDLADLIVFLDRGNIVQAAAPEEMLEHPATQQVRDFLGSHISGPSPADLTAADVMRTGVVVVNQNRGIHECVSRMQHHNVDTLLVVDEARRYQGTVSITDIRLTGHVVKTIGPLVRNNTPTVGVDDNAKDCFDLLASSGFPYLVVLAPDKTVAGIITKTSMAAAMAEHLWG